MPESDITPGELARRMNDVLTQFSNLVEQVENRYVRKDLLELYKQGIDAALQSANQSLNNKADKSAVDQLALGVGEKVNKADFEAVRSDVAELKDTNKWLFRLVIGIIVTAVLGTVIALGGLK
jgi:chaperonin cofactor prefoldin